jgi:hypothetical protein
MVQIKSATNCLQNLHQIYIRLLLHHLKIIEAKNRIRTTKASEQNTENHQMVPSENKNNIYSTLFQNRSNQDKNKQAILKLHAKSPKTQQTNSRIQEFQCVQRQKIYFSISIFFKHFK